jgi:aromatic-L-amino-acid decarboxylase
VIGTAGSINTGATDELQALAALCCEEYLWFHVDGAFGALARLGPSLQPIVAGIELADSVALDLHKWMYLPFEIASDVLVPPCHTSPCSRDPVQ